MDGWIKLHRKLLDWQWFHSPNHLKLFLVLLFRCNFKKSKWRQETVLPGQILTGSNQLAEWSNLSKSTVYRVLKDLESTGELERKTTNKYTIITITNWSQYQIDEKQTENKWNSSDTTNGKQMGTSNNAYNAHNGDNERSELVCEYSTSPNGDVRVTKSTNVVFRNGKLELNKKFEEDIRNIYSYLDIDAFIKAFEIQLKKKKDKINDLEHYLISALTAKSDKLALEAFKLKKGL